MVKNSMYTHEYLNSKLYFNLLFIYVYWDQTVNTGDLSLSLSSHHMYRLIQAVRKCDTIYISQHPGACATECVNESRTPTQTHTSASGSVAEIADAASPHQPAGSCVCGVNCWFSSMGKRMTHVKVKNITTVREQVLPLRARGEY